MRQMAKAAFLRDKDWPNGHTRSAGQVGSNTTRTSSLRIRCVFPSKT